LVIAHRSVDPEVSHLPPVPMTPERLPLAPPSHW
jgi:hypothetical protein